MPAFYFFYFLFFYISIKIFPRAAFDLSSIDGSMPASLVFLPMALLSRDLSSQSFCVLAAALI